MVRLFEAGLQGQVPEQGHHPDFPLPGAFLQLFREDPKALPGQLSDIVAPACPGSSSGLLSMEHARNTQLAPLDAEEQRLYSELLPGDRAPQPISKGAPCHPAEETDFSRLYPGSYSFGHDPKFMAIGEGRNID